MVAPMQMPDGSVVDAETGQVLQPAPQAPMSLPPVSPAPAGFPVPPMTTGAEPQFQGKWAEPTPIVPTESAEEPPVAQEDDEDDEALRAIGIEPEEVSAVGKSMMHRGLGAYRRGLGLETQALGAAGQTEAAGIEAKQQYLARGVSEEDELLSGIGRETSRQMGQMTAESMALEARREAKETRTRQMYLLREDQRQWEMYPGAPDDATLNRTLELMREGTPEQKAAARAKLDGWRKAVDPSRAFGGTGRKIMAAIGAALGAYGAALTGTPNYALQIIEKHVDRSLAIQEQRISRRKKRFEKRESLIEKTYRDALDLFEDEEAAREAAKARAFELIDLQVQKMAATLKGPQAVAKAAQLSGDAQQKAGEAIANLEEKEAARLWKARQAEISAGAKTEDVVALDTALSDLDILINKRKEHGVQAFGPFKTEEGARMETLAKKVTYSLIAAWQNGRVSDKDFAIAEKTVGEPTRWGWQLARLEETKRFLERARNVAVGTYREPTRELPPGVESLPEFEAY